MSKQNGIPQRIILIGASVAFVLSWSSGFLVAKIGTAGAPALTVVFWRFLIVVVILALAFAGTALRVNFIRRRPDGIGSKNRPGTPSRGSVLPRADLPAWCDIRPHLVIGFFAQFGYVIPIYLAIAAGVSSGTTALIDAIQPLVVATLVGPLLGLRVRALQWLGLVFGAGGVALIVASDASAAASPGPAYLLPLVALASLVTATFLERRTSACLGVFATLSTHAAVTLVAVALLAFLAGALVPPATADFWISTLVIAIVPTLFAYGLYWFLLRRIGITRLNALLFLVAPTTAVAGAFLFAEPFTPATLAGLILGSAAVALVLWPGRSSTHSPRGSSSGTVDADFRAGEAPLHQRQEEATPHSF
ncbi:DMT family transporter [Arthrobacter oryzae]|jgi:drug/metabolite transporter (DMT)-like permease|uniref:DMT family transporter n=1 Tax=Arthrobacter oryzae TaxID=409290 RepID=UPI00277FFA4C|nr:DMT family transporter [Arthrobacter oryzae]MDQ0076740.1 drug/metabolite transporter (DMT)-like permease [Arthrobacter oryzae]